MAIPLEEMAPYLKDIKREKKRQTRVDSNYGYTDERGQYYTPLPSVDVYPEPWQYDFTNIGSKKFRDALLNNTFPKFMKGIRSEEFPYKQTEILKRIYNVWNSAERPKMYLADEAPKDLKIEKLIEQGRSYNYPSQNAVILTNINSILNELAHPIQLKTGVNSEPLHMQQSGQYKKTPFLDHLRYEIPTFLEYETHSQIQPKLEDYVKTGKWPTYNGTFLVGDPSAIEKFGNSSLFNSINNLYK